MPAQFFNHTIDLLELPPACHSKTSAISMLLKNGSGLMLGGRQMKNWSKSVQACVPIPPYCSSGGDFNEPMYLFLDMEPMSWGPRIPNASDRIGIRRMVSAGIFALVFAKLLVSRKVQS